MGNVSLLGTALLLFSLKRGTEKLFMGLTGCNHCNLIIIYFFEEIHQNPRIGLHLMMSVSCSISEVSDWGEWEQSLHDVFMQNFCCTRFTKNDYV